MNTNLTTADNTKFDLWKQPGGTLGKVGLWVMGGAVLYGAYKVLPYMIAFTQNIFTLVLMLVGLGALLYVVFSPELRKILKLLYLQVCRKVTGLIVEIDPIAILENSISEMKQKLEKVSGNITKIVSINASMKDKLEEYENEMQTNITDQSSTKTMLTNPELSQKERLTLNGKLNVINNDIALLNEQIKNQKDRIAKSEKYVEILEKLEIAATTKIEVAERTLNHKKDEYEQAKQMQSAVKSITSIFNSSWLTKSMEDQMALNSISDTIHDSIAEMNRLLDGSNDILLNYDISTLSNASKVDAIINEYTSGGFESFQKTITDNGVVNEVPYEEVSKEAMYAPNKPIAQKSKYFN